MNEKKKSFNNIGIIAHIDGVSQETIDADMAIRERAMELIAQGRGDEVLSPITEDYSPWISFTRPNITH